MGLYLSGGQSTSSHCNCSLSLTVDAKSEREGGFLHPTCPRRVRTHTSVIYHHATSTCQFDNDFSPRVSKLEMLFRLQKQLHIFCFLSQRRPARMQMKGILNLLELQPQHFSALFAQGEHTLMGGRTQTLESCIWWDAMTTLTCAFSGIGGLRALLQKLAV